MFYYEMHGPLIVQKQTRFRCFNGKPIAYDPSKKDLQNIQKLIRPHAPKNPICAPVRLNIHFFFPIPKSTNKTNRLLMLKGLILPDVRPDEDNLAYIVTNALKGIVYDDDKRICQKHVYKFYDEKPRTVIQVKQILEVNIISCQR